MIVVMQLVVGICETQTAEQGVRPDSGRTIFRCIDVVRAAADASFSLIRDVENPIAGHLPLHVQIEIVNVWRRPFECSAACGNGRSLRASPWIGESNAVG